MVSGGPPEWADIAPFSRVDFIPQAEAEERYYAMMEQRTMAA